VLLGGDRCELGAHFGLLLLVFVFFGLSLDHKYATRFLELFVEEITMREKNRTEAENESEEDEDEQEETEVGSELATVAAE
jgi:hypothetical protein